MRQRIRLWQVTGSFSPPPPQWSFRLEDTLQIRYMSVKQLHNERMYLTA